MKMTFADAHFYMSVVGTECDNGKGTRPHLVAELVRLTSLKESEASEVVDELIKAGKIVLADGKYVCE